MRFPRSLHPVLVVTVFSLGQWSTVFAAEMPPVADFFQSRTLGAAKLSPDGRHVAVVVNSAEDRDRLGVIGLGDNSIKIVAGFSDGDVGNFEWVNNERLVYDSRDKHTAPGDARYAPGLYAINRDGTKARRLVDTSARRVVDGSIGQRVLPYNTFMLGQRGSQDSDSIYVLQPDLSAMASDRRVDLLRLDTVTGRATTVKAPGHTVRWLLDAKGEPRIATTREEDKSSIHYLDPATGQWRTLLTYQTYAARNFINPLAFAPDGTLYVRRPDGDKLALSAYDLAAGRPSEQALVKLEEYDFNGSLISTHDKLLGVRYLADTRATAWFDPKMKEVQAKVDARLPNTVNLIDVPVRPETPWVLVRSYADRQPEILLLYNTETNALNKIGQTQPRIKAEAMAGQDLVRYAARDGLQIPAWLTLPNGDKKNLPLVVMVHGGPYVRGREWGWHGDTQFLASRGYAVLEPEFRGSTGFGLKHFRAGWKQWGLAMQDDIADGVRWAVAQGIADPKRVCIMGASYGGYATLMGLVRDPALYKCGINYVGVTDITLLYNGHWTSVSDMGDAYKQYGFPVLVGDPVKDAEQLAATSPLKQAARISQPLLLAYGGVDRRVPIVHGRKFHDAVKATNKDVEWVVYEQEGHGWSLPATRVDFWTRVEKFLKRNIGTP